MSSVMARIITRIEVSAAVTVGYDHAGNVLVIVPGVATAIELIAQMHGQLDSFRDSKLQEENRRYRGRVFARNNKFYVTANAGYHVIHVGVFTDEIAARQTAELICDITREEVETLRAKHLRKRVRRNRG